MLRCIKICRRVIASSIYNDFPETEYAKGLGRSPSATFNCRKRGIVDAAEARGALYSDDKTLPKLIGRPTTTLEKAVGDALKVI